MRFKCDKCNQVLLSLKYAKLFLNPVFKPNYGGFLVLGKLCTVLTLFGCEKLVPSSALSGHRIEDVDVTIKGVVGGILF